MKDLISSLLLAFSLCLVLGGYNSAGNIWKGTIKKRDGVTIVKNPNAPVYKADVLSLFEELTIGVTAQKDEPLFSEIRDIAVDDAERILALDSKEAHIKIFDKRGTYLATIGEKGQGPGQFQSPASLYVTPQKGIIVNDMAVRKIHLFKLDGSYVKSISQLKMSMFTGPKVDQDGNIVARYMITGPEPDLLLKKFNPELGELLTIHSAKVLKYPYLDPFFPQAFWVINDKNEIVWGFSDRYEINITDKTGKIIRIIDKEYNPVGIEEEEKEGWIKNRFGGREFVPKYITFSWGKFHNAFSSISIDDVGHIFVGTYEKTKNGEGYFYDVFDKQGRYMAKISLKSKPMIWKRGMLYTIEIDSEGRNLIKKYRVSWNSKF